MCVCGGGGGGGGGRGGGGLEKCIIKDALINFLGGLFLIENAAKHRILCISQNPVSLLLRMIQAYAIRISSYYAHVFIFSCRPPDKQNVHCGHSKEPSK